MLGETSSNVCTIFHLFFHCPLYVFCVFTWSTSIGYCFRTLSSVWNYQFNTIQKAWHRAKLCTCASKLDSKREWKIMWKWAGHKIVWVDTKSCVTQWDRVWVERSAYQLWSLINAHCQISYIAALKLVDSWKNGSRVLLCRGPMVSTDRKEWPSVCALATHSLICRHSTNPCALSE